MNSRKLNHLAIVPDGNRRWAREHGIGGEKKVYEQGSDTTFQIIKAAFEMGLPYVTFWGSSRTNLEERPKPLVSAIEKVFAKSFHDLATDPLIHRHEVRVSVHGEWRTLLKPETVAAIDESISATSHYDKKHLTVLIGYDGLRERGAAVAALVRAIHDGRVQMPTDDDLEGHARLLRDQSWTGHLPDADLVIRTGSWTDPHNSAGFLGLITGDSQYAFPEVLWPDFTSEMLREIADDFEDRDRRLGR